jgi:hypothetical protein
MPALVALVYVPRVLREASMDDWLILVFATTFTFASKKVSAMGVAGNQLAQGRMGAALVSREAKA